MVEHDIWTSVVFNVRNIVISSQIPNSKFRYQIPCYRTRCNGVELFPTYLDIDTAHNSTSFFGFYPWNISLKSFRKSVRPCKYQMEIKIWSEAEWKYMGIIYSLSYTRCLLRHKSICWGQLCQVARGELRAPRPVLGGEVDVDQPKLQAFQNRSIGGIGFHL